MPDPRATQIFISYATEDAPIATAIEKAFASLGADGTYPIEVVRDIHSFEQGLLLTTQILERLRVTDILFILFTERLKQSHSFTGFEVGAFSEIMDREAKANETTHRRIVSLFLKEPPATEQGVLGIKLNVKALDHRADAGGDSKPAAEGDELDPTGELERFLCDLSDLMVKRQFDALSPSGLSDNEQNRLTTSKNARQEKVKSEIVPTLVKNLTSALSRVVAKDSIEQKFILLRWDTGSDSHNERIYDDTLLLAKDNPKVFEIFGLPANERMTWADFKTQLSRVDVDGAPFIAEAMQNAVASAFAEGAVDNDQIFLNSRKKLYRIIITRYYVYYDGGRQMHVYFIPFLTSRELDEAERAMTLLRLAVTFRSDFINEGAPYSVDQFELYKHDFTKFKELVAATVRRIQLNEAESHNYGLDREENFTRFYGTNITSSRVADMFHRWDEETTKLMSAAAAISADNVVDPELKIKDWKKVLGEYTAYVKTLNEDLATNSLNRLGGWFKDGKLT